MDNRWIEQHHSVDAKRSSGRLLLFPLQYSHYQHMNHYSSSICESGIDEILDLEKISRGNGSFFSISSWRIECSFLEMVSIVKILKNKFSFSSRNSRF